MIRKMTQLLEPLSLHPDARARLRGPAAWPDPLPARPPLPDLPLPQAPPGEAGDGVELPFPGEALFDRPGRFVFSVPPRVMMLKVALRGADGGDGPRLAQGLTARCRGGAGAAITVTIPVVPGEMLTVCIGAAGTDGGRLHGGAGGPSACGLDGGDGSDASPAGVGGGGGGGGAGSALLRGETRLLVAAGGGGGGGRVEIEAGHQPHGRGGGAEAPAGRGSGQAGRTIGAVSNGGNGGGGGGIVGGPGGNARLGGAAGEGGRCGGTCLVRERDANPVGGHVLPGADGGGAGGNGLALLRWG